jgi:tetratricopeptide (TPR) repeat protein
MKMNYMLSLCMIVRDSSRTLGPSLESISPWVDEIIVVDTGSLDDTKKIAQSFGAKVFDFPWCDSFSAARNESLKYATGDWLFWMDSDDTISSENGEKLRAIDKLSLNEAATAYIMQVHCPGPSGEDDVTAVDHVKLFRNDPHLRFEGRIHEQILPAIRRIDGRLEWTDIYVTHSGSEHTQEAKKRKQQRDLRLLEMELAEQPEHTFVLFNLGMTYADMNEPALATDYLKRSLFSATTDESHVRKVYALLVSCLCQLEQHDEAIRVVRRALEMFPDDPELCFRYGILLHGLGSYEDAISAFENALSHRNNQHFSSRDLGITGHKTRHNLALAHREMNRPDLAELQWRIALDELPGYEIAWHGLTDVLIDQSKLVSLEVEIENRKKSELNNAALARSSVLLCLSSKGIEAAKAKLHALQEASPGDVGLLRFACEFLFNHGDSHDSLAYLKSLCDADPTDASAWHNHGSALQRAGQLEDAVSSFEESLKIRPNSVGTLLQYASALIDIDKTHAAKEALRTALAIEPGNKQTRRIIDQLEHTLAL